MVTGNSRATRPGGVPKPAGDLGNRNTGEVAGPEAQKDTVLTLQVLKYHLLEQYIIGLMKI
jgi:hypothetical protein